MDFIKNNWILLTILLVLAYLVYRYWQKTNSKTELVKISEKTVNDFKNNITSNTGYVQAPPVEVVTTNPKYTSNTSWKIGDKIYGGQNGVNTYSAPTTGINSLVKHYNKDEYIGTFLANVNGYAKIVVSNKVNSLLETFGYEDNQVVYSLINQVYSK